MSAARVDHLVVGAASLAQGAAWCEATLGVPPGPGGTHALMGTHNRLLGLMTPRHPSAYFEIIAIDPAVPTAPHGRTRWFDLDAPHVRQALQAGPRLLHWVVQVPDLGAALAAWAALGIDRGPAVPLSRDTPQGPLRWAISVRDDGQRLVDGCLPTLIAWEGRHPSASLPTSGLALQGLRVQHPEAELLRAAFAAIGLGGITVDAGPADLVATLATPRGPVQLASGGL